MSREFQNKTVRKFLSDIGRVGGSVTGASKLRGGIAQRICRSTRLRIRLGSSSSRRVSIRYQLNCRFASHLPFAPVRHWRFRKWDVEALDLALRRAARSRALSTFFQPLGVIQVDLHVHLLLRLAEEPRVPFAQQISPGIPFQSGAVYSGHVRNVALGARQDIPGIVVRNLEQFL